MNIQEKGYDQLVNFVVLYLMGVHLICGFCCCRVNIVCELNIVFQGLPFFSCLCLVNLCWANCVF